MVGEQGWFTKLDIEQYASELIKSGKLMYHLGYVPDETIPLYFSATDLVILPYREEFRGTSGVLQLASAYNIPVIASNVGQSGLIIEEHKLGLLSEPNPGEIAEKIDEYFALDLKTINFFKINGKKYSSITSTNVMCDKIKAAYQKRVG